MKNDDFSERRLTFTIPSQLAAKAHNSEGIQSTSLKLHAAPTIPIAQIIQEQTSMNRILPTPSFAVNARDFGFSRSKSKQIARVLLWALPIITPIILQAGPLTENVSPDAITPEAASIILFNKVSASYGFSTSGDLERDGKIGEVEISRYKLSYDLGIAATESLKILPGVFWTRSDLDFSAPVALPDELQELGVSLGLSFGLDSLLGDGWAATLMTRPGFYSASSDFVGDSFDAPTFFVIGHEGNTLAWNIGVRASANSDDVVMPVAGVRWNISPSWTLSLGLPETAISYEMTSKLTLKVGANISGGNYYVEEAPNAKVDRDLSDTWLEYREVGVGAGLDYKLSPNFSLTLEGGTIVDRNFDYFDRNYEVESGNAGYFTFGFRGKF